MSINVETLSTFTGIYIGFYRPNKNVYNIIQYNNISRKWEVCPNLNSDQLIRRRLIDYNLFQTINVALNISGRRRLFNAHTSSLYLEQVGLNVEENNKYIPILKEYPDSKLTKKYRSLEHTAVSPQEGSPLNLPIDPILWRLVERPVVLNNIPALNYSINSMNEPISEIPKLPTRIAWIIAEDACKKSDNCPITMEPLSPVTASVTSCYHVFYTDAIDHWLTEHKTCPVCKQVCSISKAFV